MRLRALSLPQSGFPIQENPAAAPTWADRGGPVTATPGTVLQVTRCSIRALCSPIATGAVTRAARQRWRAPVPQRMPELGICTDAVETGSHERLELVARRDFAEPKGMGLSECGESFLSGNSRKT
jgi:hypothetical protein